MAKPVGHPLRVAGLFSGIGGIERGLQNAGHHIKFLCEIEPRASAVLKARFGCTVVGDVRNVKRLPRVDLLAAGFPCQDLSPVGLTRGIDGRNSRLVGEALRLLRTAKRPPNWFLIENVPFMLRLHRGKGMSFLVNSLEKLGYTWAYRVVDTMSFGLPQRRRRVILLACRKGDPRHVLFADNAEPSQPTYRAKAACGFYWTEGNTGIGWAVDSVPPLKGGSSVGIASPPAIWLRNGAGIGTPDVRDAERLQGFPANWTLPAAIGGRKGFRWRLIGNAVSVPVAEWIGSRLIKPGEYDPASERKLKNQDHWPNAAWGAAGVAYAVDVTHWPKEARTIALRDFLRYPTKPLSLRASKGFLTRLEASDLKFHPAFLSALKAHVGRQQRLSDKVNAA